MTYKEYVKVINMLVYIVPQKMSNPESSYARVGIHVGKGDHKELHDALSAGITKFALRSAQIFCHGPRGLAKNNYDADEIKEVCTKAKIPLVVHASYFLMPWKKDDPKFKFKIQSVLMEMLHAAEVGAKHLVMHLPAKASHSTIIRCLKKIQKAIDKLGSDGDQDDLDMKAKICTVILCLEHKAHGPFSDPDNSKNFTSSRGFANFAKELQVNGFSPEMSSSSSLRVGLCLDTAHMFVSVEKKSLVSTSSMTKYLSRFEEYKKYIQVIHFNGSCNECGSGHDIHAVPFSIDDKIWNKTHEGALTLIKTVHSWNADTPFIIEWKKGSSDMIDACMNILAKASLIPPYRPGYKK
jgi:endonuclease IV